MKDPITGWVVRRATQIMGQFWLIWETNYDARNGPKHFFVNSETGEIMAKFADLEVAFREFKTYQPFYVG